MCCEPSQPPSGESRVLGVLAGAGEYPRLMIEGAKRAGWRVVCAGFRGAVGREIPALCDVYRSFRIGSVEGPLRFFQGEGVRHVVLTGQIKPACIYTLWPDAAARRLLARLDRRNAHSIFGAVCAFAREHGIEVLPSTTFMEAVMPGEGRLAGPEPTAEQRLDAERGLALAREIARLDIGQSLVVQDGRVLCVEGFKGTNECIDTGGHRARPVTLCKITKPGHDMRFDVPCIGLATVRHCVAAGVGQIAFEAGKTILFQREEVVRLCEKHGIALRAVALPEETAAAPPERVGGDEEHAAWIAGELERLGIGSVAVVCDGVVIAVGDADGPLKCLERAGAYMKRLRFARLANWLMTLLTGRRTPPPAPMLMAGRAEVDDELRMAARRAGVVLGRGLWPPSRGGAAD